MLSSGFSTALAVGCFCLFAALPALADKADRLSTDVKRLEVRTDSCEAIGLEFESRLGELAASLADAAEAGDQRSEAQREEIERTKIQIDAMQDCAEDLELFRDEVAARLGEPPAAPEDRRAEQPADDSLESLRLRYEIITARIERLRDMAIEVRDSLMPSIIRAELSD